MITKTQTPTPPLELVQKWAHAAQLLLPLNESASRMTMQCAIDLARWIDHEGLHLAMCLPPSVLRLIHVALHAVGVAIKDLQRSGTQ